MVSKTIDVGSIPTAPVIIARELPLTGYFYAHYTIVETQEPAAPERGFL